VVIWPKWTVVCLNYTSLKKKQKTKPWKAQSQDWNGWVSSGMGSTDPFTGALGQLTLNSADVGFAGFLNRHGFGKKFN
jgi:hypothetical protein